ncbi:hypothetical protein Y1Q_0015443 [Alligator mississippiensis]|uniref:Uncharacterized protein n=1 Tax=Alligator mississippiensis TaxID=8496 RepID=A0A151NCW5_ALLMI|nr:hypothetical protein Y1Q_0015443 [Alligator mississippiensis]
MAPLKFQGETKTVFQAFFCWNTRPVDISSGPSNIVSTYPRLRALHRIISRMFQLSQCKITCFGYLQEK